MKECINYKKIDYETVQCLACSHRCLVSAGKTGICGIRLYINGKLYLFNYGKAASTNIDPIEKKPLFHFLHGSNAFSFGAFGCNFQCKNCQNYDISQIFETKGRVEEYKGINWGYSLSPKQIVSQAIKNKCQSIAYTYTEPTVFLEYALDTMKIASSKGVKNVWVSNGFMSYETLDLILPYLDAINIDIKSFDDKFYRENCGAYIGPVLENCKAIASSKAWLEITTLVIPGLSDNLKMLRQIAKFIKNELGAYVPWHISAFSGAFSWQLQNVQDTPLDTIKKAYKIGKDVGLKYVYAGNTPLSKLENTYCPACGEIVIKRSGYQIQKLDKSGKCKCGEKIEGVF